MIWNKQSMWDDKQIQIVPATTCLIIFRAYMNIMLFDRVKLYELIDDHIGLSVYVNNQI